MGSLLGTFVFLMFTSCSKLNFSETERPHLMKIHSGYTISSVEHSHSNLGLYPELKDLLRW